MTHSPYNTGKKKDTGKGLSNWIGIIVFLLVIGSQFVQPLLHILSQVLGHAAAAQIGISLSSLLPMLIVGLVILSIVVSVLSGLVRALRRLGESSDSPTGGGLAGMSSLEMPAWTEQPVRMPSAPAQKTPPPGYSPSASYQPPALPRGINISTRSLTSQPAPARPYQKPDFDPLVSGKVILFGIVGIVVLAGGLAVGAWLNSVLP